MNSLHTIAHIHSDFTTKFGIPRQSGLVDALEATVVFTPEYCSPEALRGLEDFSHIWLIWGFSAAERQGWTPTVRPPRLGGNTRMGVFATRSPFRPNPLGLSCVKLAGMDQHPAHGTVLRVHGADLMDGTPIYDIKPYLPYADCFPNAVGGFAATAPQAALTVQADEKWVRLVPPAKWPALQAVLAQDPRPPYQQDAQRVYGMAFAGLEVKFTVTGDILTVQEIAEAE